MKGYYYYYFWVKCTLRGYKYLIVVTHFHSKLIAAFISKASFEVNPKYSSCRRCICPLPPRCPKESSCFRKKHTRIVQCCGEVLIGYILGGGGGGAGGGHPP
jgi:hypothetical protein